MTPELAATYEVVHTVAPNAFLIANVGAPQLVEQQRHPAFTVADARRAVAMIGARALAIHLNYLQEAAQPEGDRRARGSLDALRAIAAEVGVPVIAKETGAGISYEQAHALRPRASPRLMWVARVAAAWRRWKASRAVTWRWAHRPHRPTVSRLGHRDANRCDRDTTLALRACQ